MNQPLSTDDGVSVPVKAATQPGRKPGSSPVQVDEDVREQYCQRIRGEPKRRHEPITHPCSWCSLEVGDPAASEEELARALREARGRSVSWRWEYLPRT
jgi:hypothetical protein